MLCDLCKKNEAVMRYTEVRDNRNTEYNLCRECAELKGLAKNLNLALSSLGDMLAGVIRDMITEQGEEKTVNCPKCGLELKEFKKLGRLGCPNCYQIFGSNLQPLIKQIHGVDRHLGKPASKSGKDRGYAPISRAEQLRQELQTAVLHEEYEKAADLRDKIRQLETTETK